MSYQPPPPHSSYSSPPPANIYTPEEIALKMQAREWATQAIVIAIVGFVILGIFLAPFAIWRARQAKRVLLPGEVGRGSADAAETLSWIVLGLAAVRFVCGVVLVGLIVIDILTAM
ncbi:MAG: hypothetical protein GYB65_18315 [Chloroflexi bacterium]|nr:hypothetical protein [Chloroflexota bacterium]